MAISKAYSVGSVSGNHWVTNVVSQSPDSTQSRCQIRMFKTKADFLSGAPALLSQEYILVGGDNPLKFDDLVEVVETKLITLTGPVNGGSVV